MTQLDWSIVAGYVVFVLAVGLYAGKRVSNLFDFFLGGRAFGIFPVALSVLATETSAATIIGAPDTAFQGNLVYLQTTIGAVLSRLFLAMFFIDVYYRERVYTVYGYLARRFSIPVQRFTAVLYSVARLLASGARLYIASMALATITGIDFNLLILVISAVTLVYCLAGGLKSVVWVDVIQAAIFLFVGVYSIFYVARLSGGFASAVEQLTTSDKLTLFDWQHNLLSLDFWANPYTFLGAVIGGFVLGTATHGTDQDMVQRLLACRTSRKGRWSLVVTAMLELPTAIMFVLLGSFLWVYYQQSGITGPGPSDSVFPHFIVNAVPTGLRGLFVAAILSATMSSLASVFNALASVSMTDMGFRVTGETDRALLWSRVHTLLWAIALTGVAMLLGSYHQDLLQRQWSVGSDNNFFHRAELLTLALGVMSLVYGPLLAIFVIGIFSKRGNDISLFIGTLIGLIVTATLQFGGWLQIGWTWQVVIGFLAALFCGLLGSTRSQMRNT